jgi:seryl-tRNA synthetase
VFEAKCSDFDELLSGYRALEAKLVEMEKEKTVADELLIQKMKESKKASAAELKRQEEDAKAMKQLQDEINNLKTELAIARTDSDQMDAEIFGAFLLSHAFDFQALYFFRANPSDVRLNIAPWV